MTLDPAVPVTVSNRAYTSPILHDPKEAMTRAFLFRLSGLGEMTVFHLLTAGAFVATFSPFRAYTRRVRR